MAFTTYRLLSEVIKKYQIRYQDADFPAFEEVKAPEVLHDDISFTLRNIAYDVSEAAICENLIYPVLKASWRPFADELAIWSHQPIEFNTELSGVPDYLISKRSALGKIVLDYPLLAVVEAKKDDFTGGWAQCGLEMYVMQQLNQNPQQQIFGIVSNGETWEFAQLLENTFTQFNERLDIRKLNTLYSVLCGIYKVALQSVKKS